MCSASGMNSSGEHQPALRVVPAHQRLDAVDLVRSRARPWLVVDHELAARRSRARSSPTSASAVRRRSGRAPGRRPRRGARLLGHVHRDVGAPQQGLDVVAVLGVERDADRWPRPRAVSPSSANGALERLRGCVRASATALGRVRRAGRRRSRTRRRPGGRPCRVLAHEPSRSRARELAAAAGRRSWWPSVSLISLNRSRSMSSTRDPGPPLGAASASASLDAARGSRSRFGRPVSASCSAWCSISSMWPRSRRVTRRRSGKNERYSPISASSRHLPPG